MPSRATKEPSGYRGGFFDREQTIAIFINPYIAYSTFEINVPARDVLSIEHREDALPD